MTPKPAAPTTQSQASNATGTPTQPWYAKGLMFKCEGTSCGDCCSGKWGAGFVWVDHAELTALAEHLNIPFDRFTRSFVRQIGERYSLIEKPNHDCIFYDPEVGCTVYAARPRQCRTYPFWPEVVKTPESWAEEAHNCPGINCGEPCDLHPAEEIDRLKKLSRRKQS